MPWFQVVKMLRSMGGTVKPVTLTLALSPRTTEHQMSFFQVTRRFYPHNKLVVLHYIIGAIDASSSQNIWYHLVFC
jgi:hypothetical protein